MQAATHKEAAHFLGVAPGTLANRNTQGRGPFCFFENGRLRYPYEGENGLIEYKKRQRRPRIRVVRPVETMQLVLLEA